MTNYLLCLTLPLGLISVITAISDWTPIVGTGPALKTIEQPIVFGGSIKTSSSSKSSSSITFNGQTITTNIGDATAAAALGPALTVDTPDLNLTPDIDTDPRYLGYEDGKILNGLFTGPAAAAQPDQCSVDKYAFEEEGTIQYDVGVSKMDQFTLCAWMRFTNHNGDHSMFTYSTEEEPREIQFWIANSKGSSYFSLAVHGQTLFRLNYPLKLRKWHHACTSWNGKTGEWQLWVKAERVGRGFHNRIVGHVIGAHGIAYSGGPSITGAVAPGHHMEITVLQLYKVALSAGKAHRDHKHHHVHHFNHDGLVTTTPQPTLAPQQTTPNPLLANGPVFNSFNLNAPVPQPAVSIFPGLQNQRFPGLPNQRFPGLPNLPSQTQFMSGQFSSAQRLVQEQFTLPPPSSSTPVAPTAPVLFPLEPVQAPSIPEPIDPPSVPQPISSSSFVNLNNPANVKYIDDVNSPGAYSSHVLFKRNENAPRKTVKVRRVIKRASDPKKINRKRALIALSDGSFVDDKNIADNGAFIYDGLAQFGAVDFQDNLNRPDDIEDEIRQHDREAAEDEVTAVLSLCSSCQPEPFIGAVALAWKTAKIQPENALKGRSVGSCGAF